MRSIIGIDLAWGEKNPDGVAALCPDGSVTVDLVKGDAALFDFISQHQSASAFLAVDAPLICRNPTGARPVDRECSRLFRKHEAGCHPVNLSNCERPLRIAERLQKSGYDITTDLAEERKYQAAEVYPHPATIRWFNIDKTIKYKKGRVADRRIAFAEYQKLLAKFISDYLPQIDLSELLTKSWSKDTEDMTDAVLCALIGHWHINYAGRKSQALGDDESGHILIPL